VSLSSAITRVVQGGKMQTYMALTFLAAGAAVLVPGMSAADGRPCPKCPPIRFMSGAFF
jgi:multicomponent Na+:H+ antiporter subunit A